MTDTRDAPALTLRGELTIFTAATIKDCLIDGIRHGGNADLEIDLSEIVEIDTAGLQLMVLAKREAASIGRTLRFSGHSTPVLDIIDLTGLAGFFGDPVLIRSNA